MASPDPFPPVDARMPRPDCETPMTEHGGWPIRHHNGVWQRHVNGRWETLEIVQIAPVEHPARNHPPATNIWRWT